MDSYLIDNQQTGISSSIGGRRHHRHHLEALPDIGGSGWRPLLGSVPNPLRPNHSSESETRRQSASESMRQPRRAHPYSDRGDNRPTGATSKDHRAFPPASTFLIENFRVVRPAVTDSRATRNAGAPFGPREAGVTGHEKRIYNPSQVPLGLWRLPSESKRAWRRRRRAGSRWDFLAIDSMNIDAPSLRKSRSVSAFYVSL